MTKLHLHGILSPEHTPRGWGICPAGDDGRQEEDRCLHYFEGYSFQEIARLLRTAQGQLEGILKMVEEDRYCLDISGQIMAADAILRRANREVLQAHLDRCVLEAVESGDREMAREKLAELAGVLEKLMK